MRMKHMYKIVLICLILTGSSVYGQSNKELVLDTGNLDQQIDFIFNKSNSYNEYKVIKITNLNKFKNNLLDSLSTAKSNIANNKATISQKNNTIDTLQSQLANTENELQETIQSKNEINILGIQIDKKYYNSLMWTILLVLSVLLVISTMFFRRSNSVTVRTKKELEDLKNEYDEYRNQTRINKEKMVVKHHDELKKMKEQMMKPKSGPKY